MGCEGSYQDDQRLQGLTALALLLSQLVDANHKGRDRSIVREYLNVLRHLLDELMNTLQRLLCRLAIVNEQLAIRILATVAKEQRPELLQEAVTAVNTVGVPRLALLHRTQEHFIETQGVSTILLDNHIRVDHVEHRLRHLFDSPATLVLTILKNELCVLVFRTPGLEGINVQHVSRDDVDVYVDRSRGVLVLQSEADELTLVGTLVLNTIDEVGATLNHTLVDQLLEGLILARVARIIEKLVPETTVDEVTSSVLRTTYVEVYITPVFVSITTDKGLLVLGVHIAQIVSRTAGKARHRVQFQGEDGLVVDFVLADHLVELRIPRPDLSTSQWGLTSLGGLVLVNLRKFQRQTLLGNHIGHIVLIVDRERLTPVALTAEDGVTQTIVHFHTSKTLLSHELLRGSNSLLHGQSVEAEFSTCRVAHDTLLGIVALFAHVSTLNQRNNGQIKVLGKGIVTRVVSRHSHDGTCTIACKDVFCNPDRYFLVRKRIDSIASREHARHLVVHLTVALCALLHVVQILVNFCLLLRCGEFSYEV